MQETGESKRRLKPPPLVGLGDDAGDDFGPGHLAGDTAAFHPRAQRGEWLSRDSLVTWDQSAAKASNLHGDRNEFRHDERGLKSTLPSRPAGGANHGPFIKS